MILSPDELEALTGKQRPAAQARELAHLCIPYKRRRDGSIVVLRADIGAERTQEPRLRLRSATKENGQAPTTARLS
jgi:hypothetical protein